MRVVLMALVVVGACAPIMTPHQRFADQLACKARLLADAVQPWPAAHAPAARVSAFVASYRIANTSTRPVIVDTLRPAVLAVESHVDERAFTLKVIHGQVGRFLMLLDEAP